MQKSSLVRPLPLAFATIAILGFSIAPATARSRAARAHPSYYDFYALAPSEAEPSTVTHHAGDCFQTNNAVEATRGIRHWTGACAGGH